MEWELFCEEQAQFCEQRAAQLGDKAREHWLALADDWHIAATDPEPPIRPKPMWADERPE